MAQLDDSGAYVPWKVRRARTWQKDMVVKQDGVPTDITAFTLLAGIRASEDNLNVGSDLATFTTTKPAPTLGQFRITLPTGGNLPVGTYYWYLTMDNGAGVTTPVMSGPLTVDDWV